MKYAWDIENIGTLARRMDQEKQRVNSQIEEMQKCKAVLETALQGEAGIALQDAIRADVERMQAFSKEIDIQVQKLRAVGNKCYEACEEALRGKMSEVEANMK